MSGSAKRKDTPAGTGAEREVLASLPRRRPQRLTARREATRKAAGAKASAASASEKATRREAPKPAARARVKPDPVPARRAPAPRQGFASDERDSRESAATSAVIAPALRLAGGLAQSGLSVGGRLLDAAFSRLSGR